MSAAAPAPGAPARAAREPIGRIQLVSLIGTIAIAAVVGVWAYLLPREFYDHFPSVLGEWISQDGPFNEHLIRDHGAQYLALGAGSVAALFWRSRALYRVLGIAWGGFAILHAAYHVTHLAHMATDDRVALVTVLLVAVALGIGIAVEPWHHPRTGRSRRRA
ncbi:hypothetical protein GCM10027515_09830 [Schumannella luteola]|uniref:DUF4383 domain-containing protein n=1 Tax=Schumannella luteola TaxID=472059 RepID=A0A852Y872_9MICO|nr:hypothetical protein [Schumannella luteola]NYG97431.1 hypothetical protein [Schumannella luteola]